MKRKQALDLLAERIVGVVCAHPTRVAIDGVDASGKTTLADELALALQASRRQVIRASIDGFHRPRAERYRRGPNSPEGYYLDSFDYVALSDALLAPLGPMGSRIYHRAVFDVRADRPRATPEERAPENAILVMDGVFLLRPELDAHWDYRIWVEASFDVAMERALRRDSALFGSEDAAQARYQARYIPGQCLYLEAAHPRERANALFWNDDLRRPQIAFRDDAGHPPGKHSFSS